MHRIHVSDGVVLGKRGVGEANTAVAILTKDMGLLRATARSARFEKSKLRYGLEALTTARFSFVRGKHEWKIVGVERVSHDLLASSSAARAAAGRVTRLLLRLIHGEEHGPTLFNAVCEGFSFIAHSGSTEEIESIECVIVLRVLSQLGYLGSTPELAPFTENHLFSLELAKQAAVSKTLLIRTINNSLAITGL